jgi:hypothetical protein
MTTAKKTVFGQVVEVTYEYLGPAAERFVIREIEAHLGKKPEQLTEKDLPKLLEWSRLAIALMTEDKKIIEDFSENLMAISEKHSVR